MRDRETISRLPCQILFIEERDRGVMIDCIAAENAFVSDDPVEQGTPFAVELSLPDQPWAIAVQGLLRRWARDGDEVQFNFHQDRNGTRLAVTDGTDSVLLDL
jgi:hypothetical protein